MLHTETLKRGSGPGTRLAICVYVLSISNRCSFQIWKGLLHFYFDGTLVYITSSMQHTTNGWLCPVPHMNLYFSGMLVTCSFSYTLYKIVLEYDILSVHYVNVCFCSKISSLALTCRLAAIMKRMNFYCL